MVRRGPIATTPDSSFVPTSLRFPHPSAAPAVILIGVIGGIASGKSLVCDQLRRLGAVVIAADQLGHEVLADPEVRATLVARWGISIVEPDGAVNRREIARRVFAAPPDGPRELAYLEQLTHPRIAARIRTRIEQLRGDPAVEVAVLDAPLMLEAGWAKWCDGLVFVDAPLDERRRRASGRGWAVDELSAREARQTSLDEKRRLARWTIDNSRSSTDTLRQVERIWQELKLLAGLQGSSSHPSAAARGE